MEITAAGSSKNIFEGEACDRSDLREEEVGGGLVERILSFWRVIGQIS
jgi:hypothetical protein